MKIFGRKPTISAWIGMAIVATFIFMAVFAPWIAPYGEAETVSDTWASPSMQYWLGTDNIGRDMLSRIIFGARTTISVALAATILSFAIGMCAGLFASIGGQVVDTVLSRFVDIMLSIPMLVFALIILSMFGSSIVTHDKTKANHDTTPLLRQAPAVSR
jgi:peptide/nickel transport system permease protein